MKQKVLYILLLLFACAWNTQAWGQTYNGGTWYSLYDDDEKTNVVTNTDFRKSDVFAPTNNTISFDYKRYTKISTKANLYVHQSEDGNDFSQANGSVYIDNTSYSNSNGSITIKSNICKIKFRSSSTGYSLKNIKIPLAKHILLDYDDTTYGTTEKTFEAFDETIIGETSAKKTINLRSFLTNGNISISSSNPAFYCSTNSFPVGANACASANGSGTCSSEHLGHISNYSIDVYFKPTTEGEQTGDITISDGTSTATVHVSGTAVKKYEPTFSWEYDKLVTNTEYSSFFLSTNTETNYTITSSNPAIANVINGKLVTNTNTGTVTFTVTQEGNNKWYEKTKTYEVTVETKGNHVPFSIAENNYTSFVYNKEGHFEWYGNPAGMHVGDFWDAGGGFNWDEKYVDINFEGIPDKLYFHTQKGQVGATGVNWYVKTSADGVNWTQIWTSTSNDENIELQLEPTDQYIRFCYSGNFGATFDNVSVTELKYFKSDKTELNFGTNDEGASVTPQSFTFSFCNAGIPTNISIDDTNFSVSLSQVPNTGRDKMGTQEISVTYLNTTPGEHTGTLTIADEEGNKQTVSLKGTTNITTLNLYPDQALSYTAGKTYPTVILNRTLKQGYNTLALPFDTDVETLTGRNNSNDWVAQLALVTKNDQDGYTLYFTKVEDGTITANQPYILYLGTAVVNPSWTNMTVVAAESESFSTEKNKGWTMKSNYEPEFSMSGKYGIVNKDGNIQKGASSSTLKAFSAYLEGPANSQVKAAFLDDATAIEEILQQADEDTVIKRIENGKLVILQGDKKYNASGVRLK